MDRTLKEFVSTSQAKVNPEAAETRKRLEKCWPFDVNWTLYPKKLAEGCKQFGKSLGVPPSCILCGLIILSSFMLSPAQVTVPGTSWAEPVLTWITISMSTGSRKTTIYRLLSRIVKDVKQKVGIEDTKSWEMKDTSFPKMGELMADNDGRLLGIFDELSAFLAKINIFNGKSICDSNELSMFLELYNGNGWSRNTVSGEANFQMPSTSLTVGGFNQPPIARSLIEIQRNAEKGLSQRFLWFFPKPICGKFCHLQQIDQEFYDELVKLFTDNWQCGNEDSDDSLSVREFTFSSDHFATKYDEIQEAVSKLAGLDDLLAGMLSKSTGQILRVAACFNVLFEIRDEPWPKDHKNDEIIDAAIIAACDFVDTCCIHTAFMAGRSTSLCKSHESKSSDENFFLMFPGNVLILSDIINARRFRNRGKKEEALTALTILQNDGLGMLSDLPSSKHSAHSAYQFTKAKVPDSEEDKEKFAAALMKHGVSLVEYMEAFEKPNFTYAPPSKIKRPNNNPNGSSKAKKSKEIVNSDED